MTTEIVMVTSDQNGFGTLGNEKGLDIDNKETMHYGYELSPDQSWLQMSFVHLFGCCPRTPVPDFDPKCTRLHQDAAGKLFWLQPRKLEN